MINKLSISPKVIPEAFNYFLDEIKWLDKGYVQKNYQTSDIFIKNFHIDGLDSTSPMHNSLLSKLVSYLLSQEDMKQFKRSLILPHNDCTVEDTQITDDFLDAVLLKGKQQLIDCKTERIMPFMKIIYDSFFEGFRNREYNTRMHDFNRSWRLVKHLYNNILLLKNNYRHAIDITDYVTYCQSLLSNNTGAGCWCWIFWDEYRQDLLIIKLSKDPKELDPYYEKNERKPRTNFEVSLLQRYEKKFFPLKSAYSRVHFSWDQDIYIEKYFDIVNYPLKMEMPNVREMREITKRILTHPQLMEERLKLFLYEEHRALLSTNREKKKLDKELIVEITRRIDKLPEISLSRSLVDLYRQTDFHLTRSEDYAPTIAIERSFSENEIWEVLTSFIHKQFDDRVGDIMAVDLSHMVEKFIEDEEIEDGLFIDLIEFTVRPDITWLFFDLGKQEVILFSFGGVSNVSWGGGS